jgi:RimJ/RimL family protein N-acetyltransferase
LLRREFLRRTAWQREIPRVAGNILVTLGGSDPDNVTKKAVDALRYLKHRDLNVAVVIGGSNSHGDELAAGAGSLPGVRLLRDVEKLSDLMMWADVAVGASGATSWERAAMGLPTLAITVAENQRMVAAMLAEHGAAASLGWHAALSPEQIASQVDGLLDRQELRRSMSAAGRRLVDGCGARRVVKHLQGKQLGLRPARWEDCRVVWEWSNDPEVRAFAFSSDHIAWDHHTRWFAEKLRDPACLFLIAEDADDVPVGQLRADLAGGEAELTVNVDPRCRGRGLGSAVIREGVGVLFSELPVDVAVALVRTENARSIRAFEKAGFAHKDRRTVQGHPAQRLVRTRQTESCGTDRSVA